MANKFICALITVSDINISRKFYESVLGQKVKHDFGQNVIYHGDFAIHEAAHFETLLRNKKVSKGENDFELYFENDKIEEVISMLKENNVEFIHEIETQPWQQRVIRFYDPDRNIIEIGESMESVCRRLSKDGKSIGEINKITGLSREYISEILNKQI